MSREIERIATEPHRPYADPRAVTGLAEAAPAPQHAACHRPEIGYKLWEQTAGRDLTSRQHPT
jgi:hypothetical protein